MGDATAYLLGQFVESILALASALKQPSNGVIQGLSPLIEIRCFRIIEIFPFSIIKGETLLANLDPIALKLCKHDTEFFHHVVSYVAYR